VHRCERCGFERFNRLGADDDFELTLALPIIAPRTATPAEAIPAKPDDTPE